MSAEDAPRVLFSRWKYIKKTKKEHTCSACCHQIPVGQDCFYLVYKDTEDDKLVQFREHAYQCCEEPF